RRRHTRSYGDWSSDVCSSDLDAGDAPEATWDIMGITSTWATIPVSPTAIVGVPYKFYEGKNAYLVGGVAVPLHKFKFEVNNNLRSEERRVGKECRSRCARRQ